MSTARGWGSWLTYGSGIPASPWRRSNTPVSAFTCRLVPTWASVDEFEVSGEIALRAYGLPDHEVQTELRRIRDVADTGAQNGQLTVISSPFALPGGRSGMRGHARIYGKERTLGFAVFYLPLQRLFSIQLWSL